MHNFQFHADNFFVELIWFTDHQSFNIFSEKLLQTC